MIGLTVASLIVASSIAGAQQTERIARIELSNGYLSVDARSDGVVMLSAVSTLRFGFASSAFSPRTLNAWVSRVSAIADSVRSSGNATIGRSPVLLGIDAASRFTITFEMTASPSLAAVVFGRADGVEVGLAGSSDDSSFIQLIGALRGGAARTTAMTLASPDSARMFLSDAELSGRTFRRDSIANHPPTTWRTADRLFVTAGGAALAGLGASYVSHKVTPCRLTRGYCRWEKENPGFMIGSVVGASLTAWVFSRGSGCTRNERLVRALATSIVAGMPGALIADAGRQASLAVTPVMQAIAVDFALRKCRQ